MRAKKYSEISVGYKIQPNFAPIEENLWVTRLPIRQQVSDLMGNYFLSDPGFSDSQINKWGFGAHSGVKEERRRLRRVVLEACTGFHPYMAGVRLCTPASRRGQGKPRGEGAAPLLSEKGVFRTHKFS